MPKELGMGIDTRIAADLHPQNIAELPDFDDDTSGHLNQVVDAFTVAYDTIGKVHDAREAAEADINLTPAMRVLQTSDVAEKVRERATKAFDKSAHNMRCGIALLEKEMSAPVQARATHAIASEIRAHIKATKSPIDFVMKAIRDGDHDTATAALGAPPYLSGLPPEMQAQLTRMYHETHNPLSAKRLRAMQGALNLLEDRGPLILKSLETAVGVYTDPKSGRNYRPEELRAMRDKTGKSIASIGV